ncbi:ArnT family glycosyltransferase [Phenylobacterium terrae]|uniref:ArnT family glycosyltransferase n=1 Tax=Phenylobacterium terrae TaxID=2665495 RepID=A0ABW4MYW2_9CAUL
MTQTAAAPDHRLWRTAILLAAGLTAARLMVLFDSPLELYPDEAQYWLWSRTLDFGYFSKPPMVAWTIWATTAIGGDAEPFVRLASPFFHAAAALAVFVVGRRLYDSATGFVAAAFYMLMPGVQLSSLIASTDAPLLMFLSFSLVAYAGMFNSGPSVKRAAVFGAAVGLAFLSKYAALYALIGVALHLLVSGRARAMWSPATIAAAVGTALAILAPNLIWNALNGFATVQHTAANAAWGGRQLFNLPELGDFLASQFGVFGPIPFAVLIGGAVVLAIRRRLTEADLLLVCFAIPPLLIVAGQAFISRANANWSGAGYVAGSVLVAAWLLRWRARGWLIAALALQGVVAALFLAVCLRPELAEPLGISNSFKRAKGWSAITERMIERAQLDGPYTAVAVNDRFLFNAAAYYGRDYFGSAGAPPLVMWLRAATPQNQAETTDPLTRANGERVLAVALEQTWRDEMVADFAETSGREIFSIRLDEKRRRRAEIFTGERYAPRPRDPRTGLPTPP